MDFFRIIGGPLSLLIEIVFVVLWLCLIARMIFSWIGMQNGGNVVTRFLDMIIGPMYDPIRKRLPALSLGVLDISGTLVFFLLTWAFFLMAGFLQGAIPH
ncbi:MAG: YggT family protein [Ktedonobacterales bacterium]